MTSRGNWSRLVFWPPSYTTGRRAPSALDGRRLPQGGLGLEHRVEPYFDPRTITGNDWPAIEALVQYLWMIAILNVILAFCMLLAHAVIPSLIASVQIPRGLRNMRPFLTIAALVALTGTTFVLLSWVGTLGVMYSIYDKRLI